MSGIIINVGKTGFYLPLDIDSKFEKRLVEVLDSCTPVNVHTAWDGEVNITFSSLPLNVSFVNFSKIKSNINVEKQNLEDSKKRLEKAIKEIDNDLEALGQ